MDMSVGVRAYARTHTTGVIPPAWLPIQCNPPLERYVVVWIICVTLCNGVDEENYGRR